MQDEGEKVCRTPDVDIPKQRLKRLLRIDVDFMVCIYIYIIYTPNLGLRSFRSGKGARPR